MKCFFCKAHVNEKRAVYVLHVCATQERQLEKGPVVQAVRHDEGRSDRQFLEGQKMTYQQALQSARKFGARKAQGHALLAMACETLASVHAINPALVYAGAVKQGLDAKALMKLADADPVAMGDLMFV